MSCQCRVKHLTFTRHFDTLNHRVNGVSSAPLGVGTALPAAKVHEEVVPVRAVGLHEVVQVLAVHHLDGLGQDVISDIADQALDPAQACVRHD